MANNILANRYEIISEIGRGGMGVVLLAYDRHLRHEVAVKQVKRDKRKKKHDLWHEVEVLKQMEHPALPLVYDFFHEGGGDYMVMEYVRGSTLADYVGENGKLTKPQAILVMRKLIAAIEYLHTFAPPIVYGDLKPANIIIRDDGQIKLIDFGAAFICHAAGGGSGRAGTPGFSAPELFHTGGMVGECADIYSLGAIFYFMLTGQKPPSRGVARSLRRSAIGGESRRIIRRCLQAERGRRYANIHQFKSDFDNFRFAGRRQAAKRFLARLLGRTVSLALLTGGVLMVYGGQMGEKVAAGLCLILAGVYFLLVGLGRSNIDVKIYKDIEIRSQRTNWLWIALFLTAVLFFAAQIRDYAWASSAEAVTVSELPVFIREFTGQKILVRDGSAYRPHKDIILELPLDGLPQGREISLIVVAHDGHERRVSREIMIYIPADEN